MDAANNDKFKSSLSYHIRKMEKNDIKNALKVFADHGLYEGINAVNTFMEIDSNAFYVAVKDDDGEILGVCGGPFTNADYAFIGLYGVHKDYMGKGIGTQVFDQVLQHIGDRNVGISAVPDKIKLYTEILGFKISSKPDMCIYEGDVIPEKFTIISTTLIKIVTINEKNFPEVLEYDFQIHGFKREKLLKLSFAENDCISMVALNPDKHNTVIGFGCVRESSGRHMMIAPLYADNDDVAVILIQALITSYININPLKRIILYSLESNGTVIGEKFGLKEVEKCPRFYKKWNPKIDHKKIYGELSPNFSL